VAPPSAPKTSTSPTPAGQPKDPEAGRAGYGAGTSGGTGVGLYVAPGAI
jgi:hypothetical protein